MKTLFFLILAALLMNVGMAQKIKLTSANNYLNDGRLDKAKENIDAAVINPETANDARAWLYKGNVYLAISKSTNPKFKSLDTNAVQVAYEAYQKSIAIDKDFVAAGFTNKIATAQQGLSYVAEQFYNSGVGYYNSQKWSAAKSEFEKAKKINTKDTLATFYAADCALQLKETETAEKYLKELVSLNFKNPKIYTTLITIYADRKDTVKMLNMIKKGKQVFPDDLGLIIQETNYYLMTGNAVKAHDLLQVAVAKDPKNFALHYAIGANYDALAQDEKKPLEEREKMFIEAEKAYNTAIELKPDFFDSYFNLGALYFNQGVAVFNEANSLPADKVAEYEAAQKKYTDYWTKALVPLEKANKLNANDIFTLNSLKQIYARLNMPEKLKTANERIAKVTAGEKVDPIN